MGRAIRFQSHALRNDAVVDVHHYISTFPDLKMAIDEHFEDILHSLRNMPDDPSAAFVTAARRALFNSHVVPRDDDDELCTNVSGTSTRCTIDQKYERTREVRHLEVQKALATIRAAAASPSTHTVARKQSRHT